jgi:nicotinamidase-related amidase
MLKKSLLFSSVGLLLSIPTYYATNTAIAALNPKTVQKVERPSSNLIAALPTVTFSKAKVPNIAAHIEAAQKAGKPATLTKVDSTTQAANRSAACKGFTATAAEKAKGFTSCDEYPFASSKEGGTNASTSAVPVSEQNSQGGTLSAFYQGNSIQTGDKFQVSVGP